MYAKLFTIEMPVQLSTGASVNTKILFSVRDNKARVLIVEHLNEDITHYTGIQDQLPLLGRKCFKQISQAKPIN